VLAIICAAVALSAGRVDAQAAGPCERNELSVMIGDQDPDVTRCQEFLLTQELANAEALKAQMAAQATLAKADLKDARATMAQREKDWSEYFAAYVGK
jgi:hypothetical protein